MPRMADLTHEIRNVIRDEEKHYLLKDNDQQISLLFSKAFGQANPFYRECNYLNSSNKYLINLRLAKVLCSENYLAPPPWCPRDEWVCIGFPCVSL